MDHNIGGFAQHCRGVIGHRNAPWRIGSAHHIAQILACLGGSESMAQYFDGFFSHSAAQFAAPMGRRRIHRANFLFHDRQAKIWAMWWADPMRHGAFR